MKVGVSPERHRRQPQPRGVWGAEGERGLKLSKGSEITRGEGNLSRGLWCRDSL